MEGRNRDPRGNGGNGHTVLGVCRILTNEGTQKHFKMSVHYQSVHLYILFSCYMPVHVNIAAPAHYVNEKHILQVKV